MKKRNTLFVVIGFCICFLIGMFVGRCSAGRHIFSPFNDTLFETQPAVSIPGLTGTGTVDLNTATKEQLMLVPGIGETLAQNIIEYREENGEFTQLQELLLVEGISTSTFSTCAIYLSIGGTHENTGS